LPRGEGIQEIRKKIRKNKEGQREIEGLRIWEPEGRLKGLE